MGRCGGVGEREEERGERGEGRKGGKEKREGRRRKKEKIKGEGKWGEEGEIRTVAQSKSKKKKKKKGIRSTISIPSSLLSIPPQSLQSPPLHSISTSISIPLIPPPPRLPFNLQPVPHFRAIYLPCIAQSLPKKKKTIQKKREKIRKKLLSIHETKIKSTFLKERGLGFSIHLAGWWIPVCFTLCLKYFR